MLVFTIEKSLRGTLLARAAARLKFTTAGGSAPKVAFGKVVGPKQVNRRLPQPTQQVSASAFFEMMEEKYYENV